MTILEAGAALRAGRTSSLELTETCLSAIEKRNPDLNAFLTVTSELARQQAAAADAKLRNGVDLGPLHGIPIALKDVFATRGVRTTCGSPLFGEYVPEQDCTVAEKLAAAGAVLLGKTGMHELAYGITSANPHFGAVHNPWNRAYVPGGSSGGSGAAVAAEMTFMAMGSDTGGSIRIPAAFCGVVGLKPTYGRVSRRGVLPLDFSLDHMGPLTRTVRDAAVCLGAIAGYDPKDETSSARPVDDYLPPARAGIEEVRVGVPQNFYVENVDPAMMSAFRRMTQAAAGLGARVKVIPVPDIAALNTISRVILMAEASAVMEPYMNRRAEMGADVRSLFDQGRLLPATDYVNAQRLRRGFRDEFLRLFETIDVLFTPTTPIAAKPIGTTTVRIGGREEDFRLATTRFVRGINALGFPALSMPCGFDEAQMPLGLQIAGRPFEETLILTVAAALEDAAVGPAEGS